MGSSPLTYVPSVMRQVAQPHVQRTQIDFQKAGGGCHFAYFLAERREADALEKEMHQETLVPHRVDVFAT